MKLKALRSQITNGVIDAIGVDPEIVNAFDGAFPSYFTVDELLHFFRLGKDEHEMGLYIEQSTVAPSMATLRPVIIGRAGHHRIMLGTAWTSMGTLTINELGASLRTDNPSAILDKQAPSGWALRVHGIIEITDPKEALSVYETYLASQS
jgi:hypothetical protein